MLGSDKIYFRVKREITVFHFASFLVHFMHDVLVIRYRTEMEGAVLLSPRKVNI